MRVSLAPRGGDALRASAGQLDGDHGLDASDKDEVGLGRRGDLKSDEKADFFHADKLGGDDQVFTKSGRFEVIDFGSRHDRDRGMGGDRLALFLA